MTDYSRYGAVLWALLLLASCADVGKTRIDDDMGSISDDSVEQGDATLACEDMCLQAGRQCGEFEPGSNCNCGSCGRGQACIAGQCEAMVVDCDKQCAGKECGEATGCSCGTCGAGEPCVEHMCICQPVCKDPGSGAAYACGDNGCGSACGECVGADICEGHECVEQPIDCDELCANLQVECGISPEGDGCDCGGCPDGQNCSNNQCVEEPPDCEATCAGLECGKVDGCECGECKEGYICNGSNKCVKEPDCIPDCTDPETGEWIECGKEDGCGGTCGECIYGICVDFECVCQPQCDGKECGPNGCGGSCGQCPGGGVCAWDSKCYSECNPAQVSFSPFVQKVVFMNIGSGGHPGEALDVDLNSKTCAPYGDCELGLDNQLASLVDQLAMFLDANAEFQAAVESGELTLLAEMPGFAFEGDPFVVNMFLGQAALPKNVCNFQSANCDYLVNGDSIDIDACQPFVTFDNAKVIDGLLTAGGLGYSLQLMLPIFAGFPFVVTVGNAQLNAEVTLNQAGQMSLHGLIGGAVPKAALLDAVDMLPDGQLPVSKDMIKNLLDMFIKNDIDTDGDGELDAASIGLKIDSIDGVIVGVF